MLSINHQRLFLLVLGCVTWLEGTHSLLPRALSSQLLPGCVQGEIHELPLASFASLNSHMNSQDRRVGKTKWLSGTFVEAEPRVKQSQKFMLKTGELPQDSSWGKSTSISHHPQN